MLPFMLSMWIIFDIKYCLHFWDTLYMDGLYLSASSGYFVNNISKHNILIICVTAHLFPLRVLAKANIISKKWMTNTKIESVKNLSYSQQNSTLPSLNSIDNRAQHFSIVAQMIHRERFNLKFKR